MQTLETQTRFDLSRAVADWRQHLASQPGMSLDEATELAEHLVQSVTELEQRGLNEEEAFWLARRRLGHAERIAEEFAKVNPARVWRERVFWMVIAALAINSFSTLTGSMWTVFAKLMVGAPESSWQKSMWFVPTVAFSSQLVTMMLIVIAIMAVRGRFHGLTLSISRILRTRWRVALAGASVVLASHGVGLMNFCVGWHRGLPADISGGFAFLAFLVGVMGQLMFPFCLVALVTWLVPARVRKPSAALA